MPWALAVCLCLTLASPARAFRDNDGRLTGFFASIIGPDAVYPVMEYLLPFTGSDTAGLPGAQTDLLGTYHSIIYQTLGALSREDLDALAAIAGLERIDGLELFIFGEYANARTLNFSFYDNHSVVTDKLMDIDIEPISASYSNPFQTIYTEDRFDFSPDRPNYYAIKIKLGDDYTDEDLADPACSFSNYNVDLNRVDGTLRHGIEQRWELTDGAGHWIREFEAGHDPGPNLGGQVGLRRYGDRTVPSGTTHFYKPLIFLRETTTGCPIPFRAPREGGGYSELLLPHQVVTNEAFSADIPGALNQEYRLRHNAHSKLWDGYYYTAIPGGGGAPAPVLDPYNKPVFWAGEKPYAVAMNPFVGYVKARFFADWIPAHNEEYTNPVLGDPIVLVMHVKLPTVPGYPCEAPSPEGCPGAVGTDLRYWSMTFNSESGEGVYTLSREQVPVIDEGSNVATLIFSFQDTGGEASPRPEGLSPRFNWFHVPSEYRGDDPEAPFNITSIAIRTQRNDEGDLFSCSACNVPRGFGEHTPEGVVGNHSGGGFMGDYIPQTDIMRVQTLLTYQNHIRFQGDPTGGDCSTTYSPFDHLGEWLKLLDL